MADNEEKYLFEDSEGNKYRVGEVVFVNVHSPIASYVGYITLNSLEKSRNMKHWKPVDNIKSTDKLPEYTRVQGRDYLVIKGVKLLSWRITF